MTKEKFTARVAVYCLLVESDKFFLLRRANTGWADGMFTVPAGHVEDGETPTQAVIREAKEEAGVDVDQKNLEPVHFMYRKSDVAYADIFFVAKKWQGQPKNNEPEKCDQVGWYELEDLPENILPYIKLVLGKYKSADFYSEFGF